MFVAADVTDLRKFRRALQAVDRNLDKEVGAVMRAEGRKWRDDTRARYRGSYRQRTGRSVGGIRGGARLAAVTVTLHRTRPWLVGQEWGSYATSRDSLGRVFGGRYSMAGQPAELKGDGTFLWPAKQAAQQSVADRMERMVDDMARTLAGRFG